MRKTQSNKAQQQTTTTHGGNASIWFEKCVSCYSSADPNSKVADTSFREATKLLDKYAPPKTQQATIVKLKRAIRAAELKNPQFKKTPAYRPLKDKLNGAKWRLFCFTPSGVCPNGRTDAGLEQYNGLMLFDIDDIWDAEELERVWQLVCEWPYTGYARKSVSEVGIKLIVPTRATLPEHKPTWDAIRAALEKLIGHTVDNSTYNLSRVWFTSRDNEPYFNEQADYYPLVSQRQQDLITGTTADREAEALKDAEAVGIVLKGQTWADLYQDRKFEIECPTGQTHNKRFHAMLVLQPNGKLFVSCFSGTCKDSEEIRTVNAKLRELRASKGVLPITIRSIEEISNLKLDPHDNLFGDRLLTKGGKLCIVGQGDIGKSRLVLHLAASLCSNRSWLGIETHTHNPTIIMFQTENSNRRLKTEAEFIFREYGKAFSQRLLIHCQETDQDGIMRIDMNSKRIEAVLTQFNPDIVIFDPLRDFSIGDLNSDYDMITTCSLLRQIVISGNPQRAMVIVQHARPGRAGFAIGYDRAAFARNSKALHGWTRAQINVLPGTPTYDKLVIDCGKNNDGKQFEKFAVKLDKARMMYDLDVGFNFETWESEMRGEVKKDGRRRRFEADAIDDMEVEPLSHNAMTQAIADHLGCPLSTAKDYLQRWRAEGMFDYDRKTKLFTKKERPI